MLRSVCGPLLGLEPQVSGADYLSRRGALGAARWARVRSAGSCWRRPGSIPTWSTPASGAATSLPPPSSPELLVRGALRSSGSRPWPRHWAEAGTGADGFMGAFATELASQLQQAVGVKSIIAYRCGLDFDPDDGLPPGHHGHGPGHPPAAQLPVPPRSGLPRAGLPARVRSGRGWSAGVSPGYSASGWRPGRSPLATPAGTWR